MTAGADRAGLTAALLEPIADWNLHSIPLFVPVTAILSNFVSNVPAVMILRTVVESFPDPHGGWLVFWPADDGGLTAPAAQRPKSGPRHNGDCVAD